MSESSGATNRLHFGLGLYVVRIIAEHHGGVAKAVNLPDGSGVAMVVQLPLAEAESAARWMQFDFSWHSAGIPL